jgi:GDPmannose 4,6-dehydratase
MAEKSALIIGISGQDGAYLARLLLGKGYKVIGASRDAQISSFENLVRLGIRDQVITESLSLGDFRSVIQVLKKFEPDEIYNLSGQTSVELSFEQPVEAFESISIGTVNLLEALRFLNLPAHLYNACSSECFGNTEAEGADEYTPFRPRSPYAVAKSAAYWAVANYREAYGLFCCSGILFNHESPLRPDRFVTQKIVKAACSISRNADKKLSLGNMDVQRDWGWAAEFVEAMWLMLQLEKPDDFVIATGHARKLEDFVRAVFGHLGLDWREHVEHDPVLNRPADIMISAANPSKARNVLRWQAHLLMEDVAKMMIDSELSLDRTGDF